MRKRKHSTTLLWMCIAIACLIAGQGLAADIDPVIVEKRAKYAEGWKQDYGAFPFTESNVFDFFYIAVPHPSVKFTPVTQDVRFKPNLAQGSVHWAEKLLNPALVDRIKKDRPSGYFVGQNAISFLKYDLRLDKRDAVIYESSSTFSVLVSPEKQGETTITQLRGAQIIDTVMQVAGPQVLLGEGKKDLAEKLGIDFEKQYGTGSLFEYKDKANPWATRDCSECIMVANTEKGLLIFLVKYVRGMQAAETPFNLDWLSRELIAPDGTSPPVKVQTK